jgi:hypothetical protein
MGHIRRRPRHPSDVRGDGRRSASTASPITCLTSIRVAKLGKRLPRPPPTKSGHLCCARPTPPGGDPLDSLIPVPKALVVVDAGLGPIIYVGDPVSGNGMAAMTNGDKGEEVCNALRQRVATAYGWR